MIQACPLSLDAWGRPNVVTPFHHLSEDAHSEQGPLRHLDYFRDIHRQIDVGGADAMFIGIHEPIPKALLNGKALQEQHRQTLPP
jgi:hypothetical protein